MNRSHNPSVSYFKNSLCVNVLLLGRKYRGLNPGPDALYL
jgi:hypothetical protein